MKKYKLEVVVDKDKIALVQTAEGYDRDSISDQLEIIGILDNTKNLINDKIKTLMQKKVY